MSAVEVSHIVKLKDSSPLANINVIARLSKPGFRVDKSQIPQTIPFKTNVDGSVLLNLERNVDITPAGTHWIVEIQLPTKYGGPQLHTISATIAQSLQASKVSV